MVELGEKITNLGFSIIPYSFFIFLVVRTLEYVWRRNISKLIKSIWYLSLGVSMLTGDYRVDTIVMLIAFIEFYDLLFQHFETRRDTKERS